MSFHQTINDTKHHHGCECTYRLATLIQSSSNLLDISQAPTTLKLDSRHHLHNISVGLSAVSTFLRRISHWSGISLIKDTLGPVSLRGKPTINMLRSRMIHLVFCQLNSTLSHWTSTCSRKIPKLSRKLKEAQNWRPQS